MVLGIQQAIPQTVEILVGQNKEMLLSLASDKLDWDEQTNSMKQDDQLYLCCILTTVVA